MINYENDLREIAINLLDSAGVYYKNKDDTNRLLIRYYTFCEKYVDTIKIIWYNFFDRYACNASKN